MAATRTPLTLNDYYHNLTDDSDFVTDLNFIAEEAKSHLDTRVKEYNQSAPTYKLAIVLDIDDTSLSHYPDFVRTDFANDLTTQNSRYHTANAPAILPIFKLYQKALDYNVDVFFITARKPLSDTPAEAIEFLEACTAKNLKEIGYNSYTQLYVAKGDDAQLSTQAFKTKTRKMLEENGYKIVLNLGDQPSDIEGGYAEKALKVPNYLYPPSLPETFQSIVSKRDYIRKPSLARQGMFANTPSVTEELSPENHVALSVTH